MRTWITLSLLALSPMLLRSPKALLPIRVSAGDPSRLAGLFRRYSVHSFTGRASDVGKRSDSYTSGSVNSTTGSDGQPASMSTSISTEVVVTDRFFLTDGQGGVMSFESSGFESRVGDGHVVSVAWVIRGFGKSGPYFLVYNHTTGERFFSDEAIRKRLTFPYPTVYVAALFLLVLPIPLLLLFALAEAVQRARFKSAGVRALTDALESRAAMVPPTLAPSADLTGSLKELAALRDSGALTQAEFDSAKTRILKPEP
jgi:hypothetical protein